MSDQKIRNILSDATALLWQFHAQEDKLEKLERENARLQEALEEMREFARLSTNNATWIEERAQKALEGCKGM